MSNPRDLLLSQRGKRHYESCTVTIDGAPQTYWFVRPTNAERDAYEASLIETRKELVNGKVKTKREVSMRNIRAKLIAATACYGDGNPSKVFTPDDAAALGELDSGLLDPLFDAAQRVFGVTDEDIKELAGNCEGGPSGGSGSN